MNRSDTEPNPPLRAIPAAPARGAGGAKPADRRDNVSGTVLRALAVLDVLVAEPGGLGLTATAKRVGLDKATTFRLLSSLVRAGIVVQDGPNGDYSPGLKLVKMADQVLQALDFRVICRPYVDKLARNVGHGVLVGVLENREVVYVEHIEGSREVRVHYKIGERRSVHSSAIGKAIVAHLPTNETQAVVAACGFERRTEHTIVDPDFFVSQLVEIRARGWSLAIDEAVPGASSVAAPVFDHADRVVGAIALAMPTFALRETGPERFVHPLLDTSRAVSAELGQQRQGGAARLGTSGS